jgi:putative transposase
VVQILKGGTSRIIRQEFPDLEEFLWGDSFWADGYFAETIGNVDEEIVRKYIRDQQE